DYVAQEQYGVYVVVHLKNGQGTIAGVYGNESFGSLDPKRPDIYLQEEWLADEDGNVRHKVRNTSGVWIAHDSIESIRFLQGKESSDESPAVRPEQSVDSQRWDIQQPQRGRRHRSVPSPQHRTRYRKARYSTKDKSKLAAAAANATRVIRGALQLIRQMRGTWK
ncbi:MAG: DUF6338 family protein, partial [Chloroflexota bacterium]|nr:DUF6338 family protein [Chloroflexota bacterium]